MLDKIQDTSYVSITISGHRIDLNSLVNLIGIQPTKFFTNKVGVVIYQYKIRMEKDVSDLGDFLDDCLLPLYRFSLELNEYLSKNNLIGKVYLIVYSKNTLSEGFELSSNSIEFFYKSGFIFGSEFYNCGWEEAFIEG